jgi:mono/diheme cytochrome c family protein
MRRFMLAALIVVAVIGLAVAQEVKTVPAKYIQPSSGSEMYKAYCASCHGSDGKGGGPAATALKVSMPDLTMMAKKNGGKFEFERVSQIVVGDSLVPAHGNKDMPVWGPTFLAIDQRDRAVVMLRAKNLTKHIEGMQVK